MESLRYRTLLVAAGTSLLVSLVWIALAWRTPTSTFHFAPLIASAVGPYAAKSAAGPLALRHAIAASAAAATVVAIAITFLLATDRLNGPTFWSADGAGLEATLFGAVGVLIGLVYVIAGQLSTRGAAHTRDSVS